jgi:hypothetical protein
MNTSITRELGSIIKYQSDHWGNHLRLSPSSKPEPVCILSICFESSAVSLIWIDNKDMTQSALHLC